MFVSIMINTFHLVFQDVFRCFVTSIKMNMNLVYRCITPESNYQAKKFHLSFAKIILITSKDGTHIVQSSRTLGVDKQYTKYDWLLKIMNM